MALISRRAGAMPFCQKSSYQKSIGQSQTVKQVNPRARSVLEWLYCVITKV